MTTSRWCVAAVLSIACISPLLQAQSLFDDSSMRQEAAQRIAASHGIRFDWQQSTLMQLIDAESRLDAVRRIKQNHGIEYDWRKYSLMQLVDAETRMDTAKQITRVTGRAVDWRKYSLVQLMEMELRIQNTEGAAARSPSSTNVLSESTITQRTVAPAAEIESPILGSWEMYAMMKDGVLLDAPEGFYTDFIFNKDGSFTSRTETWSPYGFSGSTKTTRAGKYRIDGNRVILTNSDRKVVESVIFWIHEGILKLKTDSSSDILLFKKRQ